MPVSESRTPHPHRPRITLHIGSLLLGLALQWPLTAWAALPVGAPAPAVRTTAALAGKSFDFDLAKALQSGPVVLYFFPKAFTEGCTIEANAFAQATQLWQQAQLRVRELCGTDTIAELEQVVKRMLPQLGQVGPMGEQVAA